MSATTETAYQGTVPRLWLLTPDAVEAVTVIPRVGVVVEVDKPVEASAAGHTDVGEHAVDRIYDDLF